MVALCFPGDYDPTGFEVRFRGKRLRLGNDVEEAARAFHRHEQRGASDAFRRNFWMDWRGMLPPDVGKGSLEDFTFRERKSAKKKPAQARRDCLYVDRPGIFLGRGSHPDHGRYRPRIHPEAVTVNAALWKDPVAPSGRRFAGVVNDAGAEWLARWEDPISGRIKYVYPAIGRHDREKFERARKLARAMARVRKASDKLMRDAQTAETGLVVYLLDLLAVRIGGEANSEGVAGLTTLRGSHVRLSGRAAATFRFLGKDSVPFERKVTLAPLAAGVLTACAARAGKDGLLFPGTSARSVNAALAKLVPGVSAKTFRTYKASTAFETALLSGKSVQEAREAAAEHLNHKRADSKLQVATTTSNYIDPRIAFAYGKRHDVPPAKLFTPTQLARFAWAVDEATADFRFATKTA